MSESLDSLHPTLQKLPGTTIVDRYTVDEALGVGGMGAVFRGRHLGLKRDVAIKVLHPDLTRDPEISKRFDREAHSASRLDHPNCLRVTDVGSTDDGVKFMIMDLLSGSELAERMGERISAEHSVVMTLQILRGLEHAHENGVIHRDVKPENIFVTRDHDGHEVLKLVDFGIAKLVGGGTKDTRMTKAGLIFGTPAYMSPEQAMGMEADARADLYAVGIILYEMLSGVTPFEADDPVKLVRMQVSKDPPPLPDDVEPALANVVMKLMAKDRDERYQSATEAREALELIIPVVATSDMISGVAILSGASGPIMINAPVAVSHGSSGVMRMSPSASGAALMPPTVPSDTGESSGAFSPSSLPTLPPGAGAMRAPRRNKLPLIGGAAVLVLGLVAWFASSSGGESTDEGAEGDDGLSSIFTDDEDELTPPAPTGEVADGPDVSELTELDQLILASKLDEAQALLKPMLDEHNKSAALWWRQGRIFDKRTRSKTKNKREALDAYGKALEYDPALIEDHDFYAQLNALLGEPKLRSDALDFAVRNMGLKGHKFLLELVNNDKPLPYGDRHRALAELEKAPENEPLVDWKRHKALDLWQAGSATNPCATYREALDTVAGWEDPQYLPDIRDTKLPKIKTGDDLTDEEKADAAKCEGLEERRTEVLAVLGPLVPAEEGGDDDELVIDDEPAEEGKSGGSKKGGSGSKGGGSKSGGSKKGGSGSKSGGSKSGGGGKKKKCGPIDFVKGKCR